jgi:hypothetical protein
LRKENLRLQDLSNKANVDKNSVKEELMQYLKGLSKFEETLQKKDETIKKGMEQVS